MIRAPISSSVCVSSSESRNSIARVTDIFENSWMFLSPTVTASTSGLSRAPPHCRARPEAHVLLDPLALLRRVRLAVAALEVLDDALEREHVRAPPAHPVAVADVDPLAVGAVQEEILLLRGQLLPRLVEVDLPLVGDRLDHRLVEARAARRPRDERALADRERRVGDEQVGVDLLLRAEARAARAGAVRRVEREDPRLELGQRRRRARGRRTSRRTSAARRPATSITTSPSASEIAVSIDCASRGAQVRLHDQPVDDDLDRVLELLVEDDLVLEQADALRRPSRA